MKLSEIKTETQEINLTTIDEVSRWLNVRCDRHINKDLIHIKDGVVDVSDVVIFEADKINLPRLPIKFGKVNVFVIRGDSTLSTLEGCPDTVDELFAIYECPKITSLEHSPKTAESFRTENTSITSLEHAPTVDVSGDFAIPNTRITSLKGSPLECGVYQCSNLPDIRSFEGCPKRCNSLYADQSGFASLDGITPRIAHTLSLFECHNLKSLKGIHKKLEFIDEGGLLLLNNTPIEDGYLDLLRVKNLSEIYDLPHMEIGTDQYKVCHIISKYFGKGNQGIVKAQRELIEADLEDYI